jgi:hypothetical protein
MKGATAMGSIGFEFEHACRCGEVHAYYVSEGRVYQRIEGPSPPARKAMRRRRGPSAGKVARKRRNPRRLSEPRECPKKCGRGFDWPASLARHASRCKGPR